MDVLMAALVAALFAEASDRTPWCAALLGSRFARPVPVIAALVIAIVVINGLGAVAGALIGPMLTPEARALLLALALVSAGGAALFKAKAPDALPDRSEEHTSELQSLMRISYAVFRLTKIQHTDTL